MTAVPGLKRKGFPGVASGLPRFALKIWNCARQWFGGEYCGVKRGPALRVSGLPPQNDDIRVWRGNCAGFD
jgi:hypothetical protein